MSDRPEKLKKRLLTNWPKGQMVVRALGPRPAAELFEIVLKSGLVQPQIKDTRKSDEDVLKVVDLFLDRELENVARTGHTLGALANKLLYSICWIRGGAPFVGITPAGEQRLTGLSQLG